jgi:fimbrial chaperone protein
MLSVSQIPLKPPKGRSGVQIALSLGVVINVAPPRGAPQLKIVKAAVARDQSGSRVPAITVFNPSNVHALLPDSTIRLGSGKWGINLTPKELSQRIGIGLVQPGQKRRFLLPVKLPPSVNSYKAELAFTPQKRR